MTTYTLYTNGVIEADDAPLTIDENNPDFIAYQAWLALGNVPTLKPAADYLAKLDDQKATRAQIKAEYQATITQLLAIEAATNPTNAQVIAAVKFLAKTIRLLLKILARIL
jgi:hypothetical protein